MTPVVSIVMAAYNNVALLPATLETLFAQTFSDWELVIVDDGSQDGTRELLESYRDPRIRLFSLAQNSGPVVARNHAFAQARGRYLAGLDHDDLCHPERFARQVAWLDRHPETVLVASAVRRLHERGARRTPPFASKLTPAQIDLLLLLRNPLAWSSVMFRSEAARQLSEFERPDYVCAEDFDFYHRLRQFGNFAQLPDELVTYRIHPGGISKQLAGRMLENASKVLIEAHVTLPDGVGAEEVLLLVEHLMLRQTVPDPATLLRLFRIIGRIRDALIVREGLEAAGQEELDRTIRDLWWECARAGIRTGILPLRETLALRPGPPAGRQWANLLVSALIGRMRALRQAPAPSP